MLYYLSEILKHEKNYMKRCCFGCLQKGSANKLFVKELSSEVKVM